MHTQAPTLTKKTEVVQSAHEETANYLSHGIGLFLAIVSLPMLVMKVSSREDVAATIGAGIFGASMVLLYFTSTLYHAWPIGKAKRIFRVLDHSAIYILIAGTYTPFTLGVLSGVWGWTLFALVWVSAFFGIVLKIFGGMRFKRMSVILYLLMGWLIVVAIVPLWNNMDKWGLFWLVCGGLAYTFGVKFYLNDRDSFAHFIWHLFVLTGTACHFIAVMFYA